MILELDAGNTRIKWRLLAEAESGLPVIVRRGVLDSWDDATRIDIDPGDGALEQIRVASVRGKAFADSLQEWALSRFRLRAQFAEVSRRQAGVTCAYGDVARLGIDRWLALLAAYSDVSQACCVVDCGSAITVDVVDGDGLHAGGYIVPGLRLMRKALTGNTGLRLPDEPKWDDIRPGTTTDEAVNNGILSMAVSWLTDLPGIGDTGLAGGYYLTGGDAEIVSSQLKARGLVHKTVPDLVLDGLRLALP